MRSSLLLYTNKISLAYSGSSTTVEKLSSNHSVLSEIQLLYVNVKYQKVHFFGPRLDALDIFLGFWFIKKRSENSTIGYVIKQIIAIT